MLEYNNIISQLHKTRL